MCSSQSLRLQALSALAHAACIDWAATRERRVSVERRDGNYQSCDTAFTTRRDIRHDSRSELARPAQSSYCQTIFSESLYLTASMRR